MLTIKGRRCECRVEAARYPGVKFEMQESHVDPARDSKFRIPVVSNTNGKSRRITSAEAESGFRTT